MSLEGGCLFYAKLDRIKRSIEITSPYPRTIISLVWDYYGHLRRGSRRAIRRGSRRAIPPVNLVAKSLIWYSTCA